MAHDSNVKISSEAHRALREFQNLHRGTLAELATDAILRYCGSASVGAKSLERHFDAKGPTR